MTAVVLVGHHHSHLSRLIALYEENKPALPHEVLVVCNHPEPYKTHLPIIHTENDSMRDIGMYRAALHHTGWDWAFLMNDDVVIMDGDWYGEAQRAFNEGVDIVGSQPNLAHAVSREGRARIWLDRKPGQPLPPYLQSDEAYLSMSILRFIRTHAFACTRTHFQHCLESAALQVDKVTAKEFEHNTLPTGTRYRFLSSYTLLMDTNSHPYMEWFEK